MKRSKRRLRVQVENRRKGQLHCQGVNNQNVNYVFKQQIDEKDSYVAK